MFLPWIETSSYFMQNIANKVSSYNKTLTRIEDSKNPNKFAKRYMRLCNKYGNIIRILLQDSQAAGRYDAAREFAKNHKN